MAMLNSSTTSDPPNNDLPTTPCQCGYIDATPDTTEKFPGIVDKRPFDTNPNLNGYLTCRIPVEIVSHIFLEFHQIHEPGQEVDKMSGFHRKHWDHLLRTPALLSSVCRRWRGIASATPQLWTKLMIDIEPRSGCNCRREFIKRVLSRSRILPLSLVLYGYQDYPFAWHSKDSLYTLTDLIRLHSARWRSLDIESLDDTMAHQLFHNLDRTPTTDLLALQIRYPILDAISLPNPLRPRRFCAEAIRDIGWGLPMEWDNLTYLEINHTDTEVLVTFLQQTPRLTHLLSREGVWLNFAHLAGSPIVIPTLEYVELKFLQHRTDFFQCLTLPALKHLECSFGVDSESTVFNEMSFDDLIDFVDRSHLDSNSLETFKVCYHVYGTNYDRNLVQLTALTELVVNLAHEDSAVIDSYLSDISDPSVLPCLRALQLKPYCIATHSWTPLCNVISERLLPTNHSLEHLSVSISKRGTIINHEDYLYLQNIHGSGIIELELKEGRTRNDILPRMTRIYEALAQTS